MDDDTEMRELLLEGSRTVAELARGRIKYPEFLDRYDSFYFRCGLDGFDVPNDDFLQKLEQYSQFAELHRLVQDVVNASYIPATDTDAAKYAAAGRITPQEATARIVDIADQLGLDAMIDSLVTGTEKRGYEGDR